MSEQNQTPNPLESLLKVLVGAVIAEIPQLAEKAVHAIFDKHKDKIAEAATDVTADDIHPCARGYSWNGTECVPDPGKK